ncbi:hypothetical protein AAC387_Pa04g2687 [Persea americana]
MSQRERVGEKQLLNGDIYVGDFEGFLPHGMGKYTWSDGTIYEGEWQEGKMTGRGQIWWASGATYEGDFCGGYFHGCGTLIRQDGSIYRGAWRMNLQHGLGRKDYCNKDFYEGSWKEGLQEGIGRYVWCTGNSYIGSWKAGKMCGRGVMEWENGDLFDGLWLDGLRHGLGFYRFADGGFYFGTWSKGLKDGRGTFFPDGNKTLSLTKWYESVGCYIARQNTLCHSASSKLEDRIPKLNSKRTISDKWSFSSFFGSSGRISHKPTSMDGDCNPNYSFREFPLLNSSSTLSCTSEKGALEGHDSTAFVYEREYVQGILISERILNNTPILPYITKWRQKWQAKEAKRPGETINKGHRSYYLMLCLQLGIRYTVGKITPVPMREVRSSDFGPRARIKMYFPRQGSQFTPSHNSIDFFWKDYCPMVFRNLREMFKIDAADYMMSICGGDSLRELSSPGKSGSIFYLSQDERFVIKTLKKSELKVLLKMLPNYYNHVGAHDNTLITKFFGVHRITLKGSRKVRFVVMGNMCCSELRIHRRYDLKGSSQGRSTNKCEIDESTTMKDLDLCYEFHLEKSWRDALLKQIYLDCMFLESQCIIDYSLLLGLHFRAPELLKDPTEPQDSSSLVHDVDASLQCEFLMHSKGLLLVTHEPGSVSTVAGSHIRGSTLRTSAAGDEEVDLILPGTGRLRVQLGVNMPAKAHRKLQFDGADSELGDLFDVYDVVLYLGIIDILQEYNIKKKIEHAYKSLRFNPLTISAVEPKLYSKRFISFLERVFPEQA